MIRKSAQFAQVCEFRKRGFTYEEIAKIVGVSKGTVSNWLSRETWSQNIAQDNRKRVSRENSKRISLLNKARGNQFKKLYTEAERSAATEFRHYRHNPLFIAGIMLYLSDGGTSEGHRIRITSVRKDVHRIFIRFACEYLGVPGEKVRFWLLLQPSHDPLRTSRIWAKMLKIPLSQFHKYQVAEGGIKKHTLHDGVGNTIIGGAVLKKRLNTWIELALKEF